MLSCLHNISTCLFTGWFTGPSAVGCCFRQTQFNRNFLFRHTLYWRGESDGKWKCDGRNRYKHIHTYTIYIQYIYAYIFIKESIYKYEIMCCQFQALQPSQQHFRAHSHICISFDMTQAHIYCSIHLGVALPTCRSFRP